MVLLLLFLMLTLGLVLVRAKKIPVIQRKRVRATMVRIMMT